MPRVPCTLHLNVGRFAFREGAVGDQLLQGLPEEILDLLLHRFDWGLQIRRRIPGIGVSEHVIRCLHPASKLAGSHLTMYGKVVPEHNTFSEEVKSTVDLGWE